MRPWSASLALTAILLGLGTATTALAPSAPAASSTDNPPDGRFLYLRDCATCHGTDGQGTTQGQSLKTVGPAEVDYALASGRMPISQPDAPRRRRPSVYSPEERRAVVDYVRPFIAPAPDIPVVDPAAGDRVRGGTIFRNQCAACHQWAGAGGALLGQEAPPTGPANALEAAEAIRTGPAAMPSFELSDEEVNDVLAYLEYLRHPEDRGGNPIWRLGPLTEGLVGVAIGLGLLLLVIWWIGERE